MSLHPAPAAAPADLALDHNRTIDWARRLWRQGGIVLLLILQLGFGSVAAATPTDLSGLHELREILRTNHPAMSDTEFNRLAIDGVVAGLRGRVWLADAPGDAPGKPIAATTVLPGGILHVRVNRVTEAWAGEFAAICAQMATTNQLKGIALDLRFAGGTDYAAAVAGAELFTRDARDLLDWGAGMKRSAGNAAALALPVAVLINGETTGAAEALAAMLRLVGSGLLLGNPTRGAALLPKEFTLMDGRQLCVGTRPVRLGDPAKSEVGPVTPDILVEVPVDKEREYQTNPYLAAASEDPDIAGVAGQTNSPARRGRISEAELVQAHRETNGLSPRKRTEPEPASPMITDPVLARAVDLLKGLAVFRRTP